MYSFLFILVDFILFLGIFRFKKSSVRLALSTDVFLSIMSLSCIHAVEGGVLQFIHVPVSIVSIGAMDAVIVAIILFFNRKYGFQIHEICVIDWIILMIYGCLACLFVLLYFKPDLYINYASTDASRHMAFAKNVALDHYLPTNMYYSALNDGLVMELFGGIVDKFYYYRIYNIMEGLDLYLAGLAFSVSIRKHCNSVFNNGILIIISLIYWIGYPLYAVEFGFSYFSASITIIIFVILVADLFALGVLEQFSAVIMLNLGLFSLFVCYTFFIPVVFLGVFIFLLYYWWSIKKNHSLLLLIRSQFSIFLFPCIFGMLISYQNLSELSSGGGITFDGGCNNDIITNFLILLPLSVCCFIVMILNKRISATVAVFPVLLLFMIVLFIGGLQQKVSVYYYVKNNNLLWFVSFYLVVELIMYIMDAYHEFKLIIPILLASLCIYLSSYLLGFDQYVYNHNERYGGISLINHFNIYSYNKRFFNVNRFSDDRIELYKYISDLGLTDPDATVAVGNEYAVEWYKAILDQDKGYFGDDIFEFKALIDDKTEYICVFHSPFSVDNEEYLLSLGDLVFKTDDGIVLRINKQ